MFNLAMRFCCETSWAYFIASVKLMLLSVISNLIQSENFSTMTEKSKTKITIIYFHLKQLLMNSVSHSFFFPVSLATSHKQ